MTSSEDLIHKLNRLNEVGLTLSQEKNMPVLFEKILLSARELTKADGGSIYLVTKDKNLHFETVFSESLKLHLGGTSKKNITFSDIPLFLENNEPNDSLIVAYAVNHKKTIHVKDAYNEKGFDFSGTRSFDRQTGYRTKSVLTIPIKNHEEEVISVLQLINPVDPQTRQVGFFSESDQNLAESLASQAGVALTNHILVNNLKNLFESLIRLIAEAVDTRSASAGSHGKRVPLIAVMLAEAVNEMDVGVFEKIHFNEKEIYELNVAAFLHDCGKITLPMHLLEKHTKLETIYDRFETIETRIEVLKVAAHLEMYTSKLEWLKDTYPEQYSQGGAYFNKCETEYLGKLEKYLLDLELIRRCNLGFEKMTENVLEKLKELSKIYWKEGKNLLSEDELENLSIKSGKLTEKERSIVKNHVFATYRMLSQLPFPKELSNVADIAASHHERMDGKGYPRGLAKDELSLQARILSFANIFETLSAPDHPHQKILALSEVFERMKEMVERGRIDPDLYDLFIKKKVYLRYALRYLMPEQLDVD